MKNTLNANVATLPTKPKPQTSKEVIAANVKLLIEQLNRMQSSMRSRWPRQSNCRFRCM